MIDNWPAMIAVADALLEHGTLDGQEVDRLMQASGLALADIDRVFLTGGSSFVPAVRRIFVDRFGAAKVTGGDELTSVATGLALRAREQWPDDRDSAETPSAGR